MSTTISELNWPTADFTRVPFEVYLRSDIYEREQQRIFRGPTWSYLAHESELPQPGDFKTTYVGDTPIVVSRDQEGKMNAFVNRCAHRGATVQRKTFGNASEHRCVYHQWCYDLAGNLIGVPFRRGVKGKGGYSRDFDLSNHGLRKLRVSTYRGLVFGTFDGSLEPLEQYLDTPMREVLDRLFHKPVTILGYMRQLIRGNWKLYPENNRDYYHAGLLHQYQATFGLYRPTQTNGFDLDRLGRHSTSYTQAGDDDRAEADQAYSGQQKYDHSFKLLDTSMLRLHADFQDKKTAIIMNIFPSLTVQQIFNTIATRQLRPTGVGSFELLWTVFGYADDSPDVRQLRLKQANFIGPAGFVSMEDGEAIELVQRAIVRDGGDAAFVELGGRGPIVRHSEHTLDDSAVRGFWAHYTNIMGIPVRQSPGVTP
jgi:anthranilate 1,2-dioxygenase large subunit